MMEPPAGEKKKKADAEAASAPAAQRARFTPPRSPMANDEPWRYVLGHEATDLGSYCALCCVSRSLGLRAATDKTTDTLRWKFEFERRFPWVTSSLSRTFWDGEDGRVKTYWRTKYLRLDIDRRIAERCRGFHASQTLEMLNPEEQRQILLIRVSTGYFSRSRFDAEAKAAWQAQRNGIIAEDAGDVAAARRHYANASKLCQEAAADPTRSVDSRRNLLDFSRYFCALTVKQLLPLGWFDASGKPRMR